MYCRLHGERYVSELSHLEDERWEEETDGNIWEVVGRSVQHNLTWTMWSSHSGADSSLQVPWLKLCSE